MLDVHVTCGGRGGEGGGLPILQQQHGGHMTNFWQIYIQGSRIIPCLERFKFVLGQILAASGDVRVRKSRVKKKKAGGGGVT